MRELIDKNKLLEVIDGLTVMPQTIYGYRYEDLSLIAEALRRNGVSPDKVRRVVDDVVLLVNTMLASLEEERLKAVAIAVDAWRKK